MFSLGLRVQKRERGIKKDNRIFINKLFRELKAKEYECLKVFIFTRMVRKGLRA